MAINFPNNPSNGQTFTVGDATYEYDGTKWEAVTRANSDTLDSVTDRGATTTNDITVGGATVNGNITVTGTVDGRDIAADGSKLDGVESGATADQTITAGSGLTGGGTGNVTLNIESDLRGDVSLIGPNTSDYYSIDSNSHDWFINGSREMQLQSDGDLHVDGDVIAFSTTTSDARLKTNVAVVEDALGKVNQLRGVEFEYIDDGRKSAGVIAQELEAILPRAVRENTVLARAKKGDTTLYKTVQYDQLHALLIEAVKELTNRVEALEAKR